MRRRSVAEPEAVGFLMTPMIDIVFQLIVFFLLVMSFVNATLEEMTLPIALKPSKTTYLDDLLVVNILKDGTIRINGRRFFDGKKRWTPQEETLAFTKLENLFSRRRLTYRDPADPKFASYFVLIRADRSSDFEHVQRIMMMATHYGGVTKVMFAAKEKEM